MRFEDRERRSTVVIVVVRGLRIRRGDDTDDQAGSLHILPYDDERPLRRRMTSVAGAGPMAVDMLLKDDLPFAGVQGSEDHRIYRRCI